MAQRNKLYFITKFVANYVVTAADMQDFVESSLFYIDEIGWFEGGYIMRPPVTGIFEFTDIHNQSVLQLPALYAYNPSSFNASENLLSSFVIPSTWLNCTSIDMHTNSLVSVSIPHNLAALISLDFHQNILDTFIIDPACTSLQTINLSDNVLENFEVPGTFTLLTSVDLSLNKLLSSAIDTILIPLAAAGGPTVVDLSGGSNAAIGTWSPAAVAAKATIIANGGSVANN